MIDASPWLWLLSGFRLNEWGHSRSNCDNMRLTPVPASTSPHYLSRLILFLVKCPYQNAVHNSYSRFVRTTIACLISLIILEECPWPEMETRVFRPLNLLIFPLVQWFFNSFDLSGDRPWPSLSSILATYPFCGVHTDEIMVKDNKDVSVWDILDYLGSLCEIVRGKMTDKRWSELRRFLAGI
jgi:hypothetical protein